MSESVESLKRVVAGDFEYFRNWYDFSFSVEKYLSEREMEKVFSVYRREVFDILVKSECNKTAFRRRLLAMFNLSDSVDYEVDTEIVRLAVTKKELLVRTMKVAGAIFFHMDIVKIIGKKALGELINFIGQDTYTFIVKRGMMLWKIVPELHVTVTKSPIVERIAAAGKLILCRALVGLPIEVKKRLELIFGERFDIPERCDEPLARKCFSLIQFSMKRVSGEGGR
ncbi:MAG: SctK family type III secretion system sorting platform protein [Puniceicoccales bacterium]|jgi:hypothetical protein|nr:SctK family type III secretion system sorting platform protein [Puniceicoccales bacterium]